MKEQLYTIPIHEAFESAKGCPFCTLKKELEEQSLHYIMGAAMMEPDIRIVTNKMGFCKDHFEKMLNMGNRLSLSLILQSHLHQVRNSLAAESKRPGRLGKIKKYEGNCIGSDWIETAHSCYICNRVEDFEKKYMENAIYMWKKDSSFRDMLQTQPWLCLRHAGMLLEYGQKGLSEDMYLILEDSISAFMRNRIDTIQNNIDSFCRSFDHSRAHNPISAEEKNAALTAICFLEGDLENDGK